MGLFKMFVGGCIAYYAIRKVMFHVSSNPYKFSSINYTGCLLKINLI